MDFEDTPNGLRAVLGPSLQQTVDNFMKGEDLTVTLTPRQAYILLHIIATGLPVLAERQLKVGNQPLNVKAEIAQRYADIGTEIVTYLSAELNASVQGVGEFLNSLFKRTLDDTYEKIEEAFDV